MAVALTGTCPTLDDGRRAVRLARTYDLPVERVWRFVTDAGQLAHWFPSRAEIDPRPGGTITFGADPDMPESTGRVLGLDEPRHLSFEWGGDELRFDLEPLDDGRTRFTLTNILRAADTAARNAAGWEICLAALDAHARGERSGQPHAGPSALWKEYYDAYVEAGVPSGAPVPGMD
ncbi:SRPBCC family protein [Streptomyces sp. NPDC001139]